MRKRLINALYWLADLLGATSINADKIAEFQTSTRFDWYQSEMHRTYHHGRLEGHCLGLAGETGEVCDMVKKAKYHKVPYDLTAMKKELGDCLWYLSAVASDHGFKLSDVAKANVEKLRSRYPRGFVPGGGVR